MGRLIISTHCTLDGLIERNDEWFAMGAADEQASLEQLRLAGALLLGRPTFEGLAEYWQPLADDGSFGQLQLPLPKYVASRSPKTGGSLPWNGRPIEGDLARSVAGIKERTEGDLVSYGCGALAYALVRAGLVDELRFWIHPVVWGSGRRPFHDLGPVKTKVTGTTTFDSGIVLVCARPEGAPKD